MPQRHHLYRHFDSEGRLLYVGQSINALGRLIQHRVSACWFDKIATVTIECLPSSQALTAAERKAIREEYPIYNKSQRRELGWDATIQRAANGARYIVTRAYAAGLKPGRA